VAAGLAIMDENNGEIWAKLDAGTEEYYRKVNRPNYSLQHVIDNIIAAGRVRAVVIQALFMRLHGVGPDEAEIRAFCDRLTEITAAGGKISHVQVYTVARKPTESYVTALANDEVDSIAGRVRVEANLHTEVYYGANDS
jgi:wyosine [tRNA(Phe)-imidazoG37] synthetase (radical SAM superfamily)